MGKVRNILCIEEEVQGFLKFACKHPRPCLQRRHQVHIGATWCICFKHFLAERMRQHKRLHFLQDDLLTPLYNRKCWKTVRVFQKDSFRLQSSWSWVPKAEAGSWIRPLPEFPGPVQIRLAKSRKDSTGQARLRVSDGILSAGKENVLG